MMAHIALTCKVIPGIRLWANRSAVTHKNIPHKMLGNNILTCDSDLQICFAMWGAMSPTKLTGPQ